MASAHSARPVNVHTLPGLVFQAQHAQSEVLLALLQIRHLRSLRESDLAEQLLAHVRACMSDVYRLA